MNNQDLETYLLASRPDDKDYSPFTQSVLSAVQGQNLPLPHQQQSTAHQRVLEFIRRSTLGKAVALAAIALVATFVSLSSYAYATGTDPFSLIKRWVSGDQVRVTYQDPSTNSQREFSHGTNRSYSDLAISAYAEVSLIDMLHFHASNSYTIPKDGIEHISDPFRTEYIAPRVGTIEQVNEDGVVVHLSYSVGHNKMEPSRDIDERVTVPRANFYYYHQGKIAAVQQDSVGKLVEVFEHKFLRHKQGSGQQPTAVNLFSVFTLSHPLQAVKEATATQGAAKTAADQDLHKALTWNDIYEIGAGAWAQTCLNNGADACPHAFKNENDDNLFSSRIVSGESGGQAENNPQRMAFGERVAEHTASTQQYVLRHIEGKITKIDGDKITIQTKSGAQWTFQYSTQNQAKFAKMFGPLKTGQLLAGGLISSVYDWDRRDFDDQYVYGMSRY